jgi:hypothetical protein
LIATYICEKRNVYTLMGRPEGRRPVRRPRPRWMDNKLDLTGIGWGGVGWSLSI